MFNNLFYLVKKKIVAICIYFCLYMLSIIVLRKKIRIGKNTYRPKKSEIDQENCNRCISIKYAIYSLLYRCTNEHYRCTHSSQEDPTQTISYRNHVFIILYN